MLIVFRWVWLACLLTAGLPVTTVLAQNDAAYRRAAIEGMYPVMLGALEAKNFGRARNICDQAILWEPQNPVHHYNLACIEAQAGGSRLPYAWGALELAIALGFDDAAHLQADPDLAPLRNDARFADLLRKVTHNASALDALRAITIPSERHESGSASQSPTDAEDAPAPPGFTDDLPVGLFLMTRYVPATLTLEISTWYFSPDHQVFRRLETGFSKMDLSRHPGPRGRARRSGRSLEITWSDGNVTASELERDGDGFIWNMGIFTPLAAFAGEGEAAGVYEAAHSATPGSNELPVTQRLLLEPDGTFSWSGVSFAKNGNATETIIARNGSTSGRWKLSGCSLVLTNTDGVALRRVAFPLDDAKTVIRPDRMYFAGVMYKRRP